MSLFGKRILVTREAEKARETARLIAARGAVPVVFPTIEIVAPEDVGPLEEAFGRLSGFDWVVVSSRTGVAVLADTARRLGAGLAGPRFAAVGQATAAELRQAGTGDVLVPRRQDADGLLAAMLEAGAGASHVLVLRAEKGRETLVDGLAAAGARVEAVVAYRTVTRDCDGLEIRSLLQGPPIDAALFLSPSAFDGFLAIAGVDPARRFLAPARLVAIGSTTAAAMRRAGFEPAHVPDEPSVARALDFLESVA